VAVSLEQVEACLVASVLNLNSSHHSSETLSLKEIKEDSEH
jgi:hypothetical protein